MQPRRVLLNGKFLSAAPTGVHRVAAELGNAMAGLIAENHPDAQHFEFTLRVPRNAWARAGEVGIPAQCLGPLTGIPWEQLTLPLRKGEGLLLNLCNIGPMLSRHAVTMIHDVQVLLSPASYRRGFRLWYRTVQPIIARRHRHLLTVSEYSRQQIINARLCRPDKVSVVHNGADHILRTASDDSVFRRFELSPQAYVVALSTTQAHKNIAMLMGAFARPELTGLKLVLFGGTPRESFVQAGITVPDNAVFAGRISDGQLRGLLEQALCLAFPSTTEGFGLPPLEAMLLGCPAIVAPCGALPEICGDAALYAPPDSDGAWADQIMRLSDDMNVRHAMVEKGRRRAQQFTWRKAAISLARILSSI